MSRATVELDFFRKEKDSPLPKFHRQRSFRDIQSAISKINPELLKSVIASASANNAEYGNQFDSKMSIPKCEQTPFSVFSAFPRPAPAPAALETPPPPPPQNTAPLTIFYNGAVAVFDVHRDKAETILKLAETGVSISKSGESTNHNKQLLDSLDGDLPIARRKSLQRFLEKRKERLTSTSSPYGCPLDSRS